MPRVSSTPPRLRPPPVRALARVARPVSRLARRLAGHDPSGAPGPTSAEVIPQARPFTGGSGSVGVLLLHGFTGSPYSMRAWAEHLVADGFRVTLPRLPGHGTTWQELNRTDWTDWYAAADRAFVDLERQCEQVFVAGLSMGGALALRLAEQHGDRVAGLALVNPCINIADPRIKVSRLLSAIPSLPGICNDIARPDVSEFGYDRNPLRALHSQTKLWADVRGGLHQVTQPTLVYASRVDHVVDPSSLALLRAGAATPELEVVTLERSYHVATLDYEADLIFCGSADFFRRHVGGRA